MSWREVPLCEWPAHPAPFRVPRPDGLVDGDHARGDAGSQSAGAVASGTCLAFAAGRRCFAWKVGSRVGGGTLQLMELCIDDADSPPLSVELLFPAPLLASTVAMFMAEDGARVVLCAMTAARTAHRVFFGGTPAQGLQPVDCGSWMLPEEEGGPAGARSWFGCWLPPHGAEAVTATHAAALCRSAFHAGRAPVTDVWREASGTA